MSTNLYISGATGGGGTGDMLKSVYDPQDTGIVLSASKEMVSVINKTGALVPKGTIVYLKTSSSSGTHPELLLASALNEATSSKTIGAVYEDIADSAVGYVVTSGEVDNLNTTAYTIGTRLWLSTTPGQVTSTVPVQPSHAVFIGIVTRSQNTNGRILYAIQNGYELGELHDVLLSSPANNDVLTFELSTGLWKNKPQNSNPSVVGIQSGNATTVNTAGVSISKTIAIPANTLASSCVLDFTARMSRLSGSTSMAFVQVYKNTSNSLTGATLIAKGNLFATSDNVNVMQRTFNITGGNIISHNANDPQNTDVINSTNSVTSTPFSVSATNYILIAINNSATDSLVINMTKLTQHA
jgi:hypothetical protein